MTIHAEFRPFARTPWRLDAPGALGFALAEVDAFANEVIADARIYPPRNNVKYGRTFRLQQGWRRTPVRNTGQGLEVEITNDVDYASRVVGPAQTTLHATTPWPKFAETFRRKSQTLNQRLQRAIMRGLVRT